MGYSLEMVRRWGGMLFADEFVGVSGSKEGLQKLLYCNKWRLKLMYVKVQ